MYRLTRLVLCILFGITTVANAATVSCVKKQQVMIALDANPTTGYQWSILHYDHSLLRLKKQWVKKPNTQRVGAGGRMLYAFDIVKRKARPKHTVVVLRYARPWEKKGGHVQQVKVVFNPLRVCKPLL